LLGEALLATHSKGRPFREWRPERGVRHEGLDARVYAFGALGALVPMGLVLDGEADRIRAEAAPLGEGHPALPPVSRSHRTESGGPSWLICASLIKMLDAREPHLGSGLRRCEPDRSGVLRQAR
jgi:hypothetical protein